MGSILDRISRLGGNKTLTLFGNENALGLKFQMLKTLSFLKLILKNKAFTYF